MSLFKMVKLTLIVLSLSSSVFANSNNVLSQEPITLRMQEIPLSKLIHVFSLSQGVNILNSSVVSNAILVNVELNSVPAEEVFTNILRCGALSYVQYENGIELLQERVLEGELKCFLHGDGKVEQGKLLHLKD